jgi:L-fuconolactonase
MIIDTHQHFYTRDQYEGVFQAFGSPDILKPLLYDFSPDDLRPLLDRTSVDKTILVQMENSLEHTTDMLKLADRYPWVAGVIGWVDLQDPQLGKTLDALQRSPRLVGIRHPLEIEPDPGWALNAKTLNGLRELARRELVFDLLISTDQWEVTLRLADAVPELSLVIEHFGKPKVQSHSFEVWAGAIARFAQYPQIACKLSGLMVLIPESRWKGWEAAEFKPFIQEVVRTFGAGRVMYGSDWPVCTLVGSYEQIFNAVLEGTSDLSRADQEQVYCETARRIYRLKQ